MTNTESSLIINSALEEDDYLLNEIGDYLLFGINNNTIVCSLYIGNSSSSCENLKEISHVLPVGLKVLGIHSTIALNTDKDLNDHELITTDHINQSLNRVKNDDHLNLSLNELSISDESSSSSPQLSILSSSSSTSKNIQESSPDHPIEISSLCLLNKETTVKDSIPILLESIRNQSLKSNRKPYHFQLSQFPFLITTLYPISNSNGKVDDGLLLSLRKQYHQSLGLPLNRPFIKTPTAIDLSAKPTTGNSKFTPHIKDVHLNLNLESKTSGGVYLVQGSYDYYHYMQDNIDDNGWGCAYRSMQTLCSWLKYQGYTNKQIPTHLDIQKILVDIQDKEPSFLKSKKWIGAFEITLCLDNLYGLECKILNVNSGADVIYKSRELARHFEVNGSPIMIGGGVLAYTLLGVDFNESTGDARYLILDPHYTGAFDNLKLIKEKGWCGWKGPELFRKDAFYNFCMPQLPKEI
eukprot:gene3161-3959_t